MKAFLSHSSVDKTIVRKIKNKLQRVWTYFDEDCFQPGDDFREAIVKHIEDTSLFVLFASKKSIESSWVKFELDEVYWQKATGKDIRVLVLALEDISVEQLPKWMKRYNFEQESNYSLAAQIIRNNLFFSAVLEDRPYVGREEDTHSFYESISASQSFPNIIALVGLHGIGRRTFIKNILAERYSLRLKEEFVLDETDGIAELYRKLLDYNLDNWPEEEKIGYYDSFLGLSQDEQYGEIARSLAAFTRKNAYPVLVDHNTMLEEEGKYKRDWWGIISCFSKNYPDCYLVILHTRYPKISINYVYIQKLRALNENNCYSLFDALLRANQIRNANQEQVRHIAKYLDGYPPAIINAVTLIKVLGVDILVNDKTYLVDFQAHTFNKYLKEIPFNAVDESVLKAVYNLEYASIDMLHAILNLDENITNHEIAESLTRCINYNVVENDSSNSMYMIAPPMRISIGKNYSLYTKTQFLKISKTLIQIFNQYPSNINFTLIDVIIKTILRSEEDSDLQKFQHFLLPSHLLKAARTANEEMQWDIVEKYARKALELDDSRDEARVYLFKALVRQESLQNKKKSNDEENLILTDLSKHNEKKYHYLMGFRLWKRQKFKAAIEEYQIAIALKDDSIPTHRELAECYFQLGEIETANHELNLIIKGRKIHNPYILDLATKIAISQSDFARADELLEQQELIDRTENVNHRYASYYMKKGDFEKALKYATTACEGERVLPEMFFLRMNLFIRLKMYDEAEKEYNRLKKKKIGYNNINILELLRVLLLLEKNGWKQADAAFQKLSGQDNPIFLSVKQKILRAKSGDVSISVMDKKTIEMELKKLAKINNDSFEQILL